MNPYDQLIMENYILTALVFGETIIIIALLIKFFKVYSKRKGGKECGLMRLQKKFQS